MSSSSREAYLKVKKWWSEGNGQWVVFYKDNYSTTIIGRFDDHGCALRYAVLIADGRKPA